MQDEPNIARLDFPDRDLFITVDSQYEKTFRAHACAKEPCTADWIRQTAHKGVFYDVGANVGSYSLIAASLMSGETDRVVAFEPAYPNFFKLSENMLLNRLSGRIIPLSVALSSSDHMGMMGLSSTDFGSTHGNIRSGVKHSVAVLYSTLDHLVEHYGLPFPNHMKIDVDGGEMDVVAGGRRTFRDPRLQTVMIEIDESDPGAASAVNGFMLEAGFAVAERYSLMSKGLKNVLFVR
ncbi:MAG: FkbM family methyltransferase [Nitrospirae bacterium]|nr:FkbM family methyltransferase [Nitrospirota bacterium]